MHCVRLPFWGLSVNDASYYGYRFGLHIGPFLVFFGRAELR